jgi:hypothetical protein
VSELLHFLAAALVFALLSPLAVTFFPIGITGRVAGLW